MSGPPIVAVANPQVDTMNAELRRRAAAESERHTFRHRFVSTEVRSDYSYFDVLSPDENLRLGSSRRFFRKESPSLDDIVASFGPSAENLTQNESGRYLYTLVRGLALDPDALVIVDPVTYLDTAAIEGLSMWLRDRASRGRLTLLGIPQWSSVGLGLADEVSLGRGDMPIYYGPPDAVAPRLAELTLLPITAALVPTLQRMASEAIVPCNDPAEVCITTAHLLADLYPGAEIQVELDLPGSSEGATRCNESPAFDPHAEPLRTQPDADVAIPAPNGDGSLGRVRIRGGGSRLVSPSEAVECLGPPISEYGERRAHIKVQRDQARIRAVQGLVDGIAHDLNNSLQSVVGVSDLLAADISSPDLAPIVDTLRTAAGDAARFVEKLLTFSRISDGEMITLDMHDVIEDAVDMVRRGNVHSPDIALDLDAQHHVVLGVSAELRTVVVNLLLNAVAASPNERARVLVSTTDHPARRGSPRLVLEVTDWGVGISDDQAATMFEPMLQPRPNAPGTGLGLAIAWSILAEHRGSIDLLRTPGSGTTFRIELPTVESEPIVTVPDAPAPARDRIPMVLVVDDDSLVLRVLRAMIEHLGYRCETAGSGPEGLDMLEATDADIMIVDQIMPGMPGTEVLRRVRELRPAVQLISLSGQRDLGDEVDHSALEGTTWLTKPVTIDGLQAALQAVTVPPSAARSDEVVACDGIVIPSNERTSDALGDVATPRRSQ